MNTKPEGKPDLRDVRAAQLRYLDQVCEAWPRASDSIRGPEEPTDAVSSDIYAAPRDGERPEAFRRRRHDWPY